MTSRRLQQVIAAFMGTTVIISSNCFAQDTLPPTVQAAPIATSAGAMLTQEQLDQLVAPVALYDDPLLIDILTASTYPLEVVEAKRWVADPANAALKGDALITALAAQDWAPSVKALVPFPQILQTMDAHLEWTEHLGEAFLAQQADVMDAVQRLRRRAQSAGMLKSSPQQTVANNGGIVTISPSASEVIYVPAYDPWCVYGPWPYPVYAPFYFTPWPGYCVSADYIIDFGVGIFWPFWFWDWGYFEWHRHAIGIYHERYDQFHPSREPAGTWRFDPAHRAGVPFHDQRNVQQFQPRQNDQRAFRGYLGREGEPAESVRPAPPAFRNYGSGQAIREQSQRGEASLRGMPGGAPRAFGGGGGRRGGGFFRGGRR
ncbi:DUF3300 domain-containing protein [Acidithiobacillus sulfuriphilus]|uniref:DUF3300 domain-containing protein n=1 Tax=Acidithiobacillus sulfuriphilus TaxID=1867749 RepID=UPI003F634EF7